MKPERTWQIVSGFSVMLSVVAVVVVGLQAYQIRLLRLRSSSPLESGSDSARVAVPGSATPDANAALDGADVIAQQVAREVRRYHQDLAAKRAREAKAIVAAQTEFLFSPDTQKRASEVFLANLKQRYGSLYDALGFSEQEIASFESVMMDRFWVMSDLMSAGRLSGVDDVRLADLKSRELQAVDDRIHALLGDDRLRRLQDFDLSADARSVVEILAGRIAYTSDPLSREQIEQVVGVVASAQRATPTQDDWLKLAVIGRSSAFSLNDVDWSKVEEDQIAFLPPAQRAIVRTFVNDIQQRQAIRADLRRVERETKAALPREEGTK